ncbi:MmcQ/YjbR family DNA-binding protein [Marimonas arenosa]|uniref:MmcQ/YjbR family DNA-binding protein n=1 Tax=Marimonas arenosa TaxID=1795305 RepID=A0AAE3WAP6_9RHOB|nr:MmcQ/YjbR family DNA-binding protein [Marimonas arenosa]MDQ2088337.1 MmcQ/YjbR family DNA-binding protein [Marimonas arenosa]
MSRELVNRIAATLPGAEWSEPFGPGHDTWKVGGKIFACVGSQGGGVSLKCPDVETAQMLIEAGVGVKAPYFHRSWIHLPFEGMQEAELRHRLGVAYDTIRAGLTKKAQAALPPRSD